MAQELLDKKDYYLSQWRRVPLDSEFIEVENVEMSSEPDTSEDIFARKVAQKHGDTKNWVQLIEKYRKKQAIDDIIVDLMICIEN